MGDLVKLPFSKISSILELLDQLGVTPHDFEALRICPPRAKKVQARVMNTDAFLWAMLNEEEEFRKAGFFEADFEKLRQNPDLLKRLLNDLRSRFIQTEKPEPEPILRHLFEDETITIAACDGSRYIGKEKGVFKAFIESLFASWGLDKRGTSTAATNVSVHEMIKDATFAQMFDSFGNDLDKLCLSQRQIVEFCEKHPACLRQEGYATFFLFKEGDQFYVANVRVRSDGLYVHVSRLERDRVWPAAYAPRVVVPQLTV